MRRSLPFALLVVMAGWPAVAHAQDPVPAANPVSVIKVEGAIDRPLLGYLNDHLDQAAATDSVVVLQVDSAGTIGRDGVALGQRLVDLPVPVLVWVGTVPARASGAGMLLMDAASLAAVSPGSQTGPLEPVDLLHPNDVPTDLDATISSWLTARDRTGVDLSHQNEAMTGAQAVQYGFAKFGATSVVDLLNKVDGQTVQTAAGPWVLHTKVATTDADVQRGVGVSIAFIEPGLLVRVAHAVATPSMVYFLLVFGLACIAFELTQPGFGFAGFSGVFLLLLGLYGLTVATPTSWPAFLLLLAGIGAMVQDVRLRRLGVLTYGGLAAFAAGSFLAYGGVANAIRISPWLIVGATIASWLYYGFGLTVAVQSRDRIVATQRGLIGLVGEARGRLAPDGPVHVKGALWRGRALGEPIAPGTKVRVRGVDGLILKVDAEPEDDPAEPETIGAD
jgi:membrane-bound serine protease (ClpP class)